MNRYSIFDHTADLGLEIYGRDERELFSNAAFAIFDAMTDIDDVAIKEKREVAVEGSDREDLLVNFLREVLSLYNVEGFLIRQFSIVRLDDYHLTGEAKGEFFDPGKHSINMEIKAVTYHGVKIGFTPEGLMGRIICDV